MSTLYSIQWHGPAETWTWPPTEDQRARLTACPASADGMMEIVAIGPEVPDLILTLPPGATDPAVYCDPGETMQVRFGSMPLAAYEALPEHDGW